MDELNRSIKHLLLEQICKHLTTRYPSDNVSESSQSQSTYSGSDDNPEIDWALGPWRAPTLKVVTPLEMHLPSEEMKIANDFNFSSESLRKNPSDEIKTYLNDFKLNENNINLIYKMLLEIEDLTSMAEYVPLVQKDVILNPSRLHGQYWITIKDCHKIEDVVVPFIDEIVLVTKASTSMSEICPLKFEIDMVLPHKHELERNSPIWRRTAIIRKIQDGRLFFRLRKNENLSAAEIRSLSITKYDIIFRSQRYPLRYQHNAMSLLGINEEMRKFLFPTQKPTKELVLLPQIEVKLFNKTIATNPDQLKAVENITRESNLNAPFIIFGPPGTGKTTVVVEAILQLFLSDTKNRILVTAGSNSACDTIAIRLCEYFEDNLSCYKQQSMLRIYSKSIVQKGINSIDGRLLKYSNCGTKSAHSYPPIEQIRKYRIIVTTLCTVGKLVTCNLGNNNFFTHIFIDEAGASTIPETLVGVMGIKTDANCRLILSGDHKQLGPILKSERAAKLGLSQSLMEHLLKFDCYAVDNNCNYDCTLQARLRRNYRSHPEILRLFNHLFYDDELIAAAKEEHVNLAAKWCKLPNPKFPIIFQAVHGETEKDIISPSSFNLLEIQVIMWFLRRLLNDGINGQLVKQTDIGIITPYKLQNKHIQSQLKSNGWCSVESGSVEIFQGREKQIIIASLVKSFSGLGFLTNPKRINVLLSRPKSLLILVGNPLTLRHNSDFAFVLDECKRHGTFLRRD